MSELKIGSFYWVKIVPDYMIENDWRDEIVPARYAGDGKWFFLGIEGSGDDGESDWPVKWVGSEIICSDV